MSELAIGGHACRSDRYRVCRHMGQWRWQMLIQPLDGLNNCFLATLSAREFLECLDALLAAQHEEDGDFLLKSGERALAVTKGGVRFIKTDSPDFRPQRFAVDILQIRHWPLTLPIENARDIAASLSTERDPGLREPQNRHFTV